MKKWDELGSWRRTHYSLEITPRLDGERVTLFGRVTSIREQGGITFIILQDREGIVQVTIHRDSAPKDVRVKLEEVKSQSILGVQGIVKGIEKAPHGAEIVPERLKILGESQRMPPFDLSSRRLPKIDKRLDLRAIDLRRPQAIAIFKIRHTALQSIRSFLSERDYLEVNTPKIISSATEGGAALFPLMYYNKEAFLSQSPQLYKEELVGALEKVFEIGPIYRAEQFRTLRHLSEIISIDLEEAYVDYEDVMKVAEEMVKRIVEDVVTQRREELELLKQRLEAPSLPFKRYTYDEVLKELDEKGIEATWGEDIPTQHLKEIDGMEGFYFIKDWPDTAKPFYIMPREDNPQLTESFDLMYDGLEIASGGTRVSSRDLLAQRLERKGFDPGKFQYHLEIFEYGMPPHAGWGLGFDRLIMTITGQRNIREVVLFPRDPTRLIP